MSNNVQIPYEFDRNQQDRQLFLERGHRLNSSFVVEFLMKIEGMSTRNILEMSNTAFNYFSNENLRLLLWPLYEQAYRNPKVPYSSIPLELLDAAKKWHEGNPHSPTRFHVGLLTAKEVMKLTPEQFEHITKPGVTLKLLNRETTVHDELDKMNAATGLTGNNPEDLFTQYKDMNNQTMQYFNSRTTPRRGEDLAQACEIAAQALRSMHWEVNKLKIQRNPYPSAVSKMIKDLEKAAIRARNPKYAASFSEHEVVAQLKKRCKNKTDSSERTCGPQLGAREQSTANFYDCVTKSNSLADLENHSIPFNSASRIARENMENTDARRLDF